MSAACSCRSCSNAATTSPSTTSVLRRRTSCPTHPNLKVVEGDIRDTAKLAEALEGIDVVLSLACISNDASFELDEKLSTSRQSRRFRADGDRGEKCGRETLRLLLVEFGLRRVRLARRDRRASAGAAHALQQVQGHVRAAPVEAPGPTISPASSSARRRSAATARARGSTCRSTSSPTTPSTTARSRCSAATRCGRICTSRTCATAIKLLLEAPA